MKIATIRKRKAKQRRADAGGECSRHSRHKYRGWHGPCKLIFKSGTAAVAGIWTGHHTQGLPPEQPADQP